MRDEYLFLAPLAKQSISREGCWETFQGVKFFSFSFFAAYCNKIEVHGRQSIPDEPMYIKRGLSYQFMIKSHTAKFHMYDMMGNSPG